jgi:hypothetical protein
MTAAAGPLSGLVVLELGQIYHGPYCGLLLAHHGATVTKVESPRGDVLRRIDRSPGGASYPSLMLNASKRGVCIDLKHPDGVALLLRLAERADVLVENVAAGVADRLGVGYDALRARNPRLVCCRMPRSRRCGGRAWSELGVISYPLPAIRCQPSELQSPQLQAPQPQTSARSATRSGQQLTADG